MITLSRALAKRLVSLFTKTLGLKRYAMTRQAVKFMVDPAGLTIESATATHAVRYRDPLYRGESQEWEAPFEAIQVLAKSGATNGEFSLRGEGEIALRVIEKTIPREEGFSQPDIVLTAPPSPEDGYILPLTARKALIAAFETTDPEHVGRFALSRVQLKGSKGSVIATDGRQLLIQTGLHWPFEADLLLANYRKLFASADFPEGPIECCKTDRYLVFCSTNWEFFLPIEPSQAYPRVEDVIPGDDQAVATLEVSHGDAKYLREVLPLLPFDEMDGYRPVTIELNGKIFVRASSVKSPAGIEVILRNSERSGVDLLCAMQRGHLQRALDLGLRRFQFFGGDHAPVVVRQGDTTYCWAAFDKSAVVTGSAHAEVRESPLERKEPQTTKRQASRKESGNHATHSEGLALQEEIAVSSRIGQRQLSARSGTTRGSAVRRRDSLAKAS